MPKRREVVAKNLEIANLDLDIKDVFQAQAIGAIETLSVWIRGPKWVRNHAIIEGTELLAGDCGKVVITPHFSTMEFSLAALAQHGKLGITYLPATHQGFEAFRHQCRAKHVKAQISIGRLRPIMRALKQGTHIEIAPDHATSGNLSGVQARFFGRIVGTPPASIELGHRQGNGHLLLSATRVHNTGKVKIKLQALDLCKENIETATQQLNDAIEAVIRENPASYFWLHRRFKPVFPGQDNPYSR